MKTVRPLLLLLIAIAAAGSVSQKNAEATAIDVEKELVIRHLSVVEDARSKGTGPWSFGGLMTRLSGTGATSAHFIGDWLEIFSSETEVNGYPVSPRSFKHLATLWAENDRGTFAAERSPFRLLAIVYRPDLATPENPGGELRFTFCGFHPDDRSAAQFFVIFEFKISGDFRKWNRSLHEAAALPFGEVYNRALSTLTEAVVQPKNFLRLRTNDFFSDDLWELRQFKMAPLGKLVQAPLDETPDQSFDVTGNRSAELIDVLLKNQALIEAGTFHLPEWMQAGASQAPADSYLWLTGHREALPINLVHSFAKNTCNGCHSAETRTIFSHIRARNERETSLLSPFLMNEMPTRANSLIRLLNP